MEEGIERRIFERVRVDFNGRFKSAIFDSSGESVTLRRDFAEGELRGVNVSGEGILARSENKIPESIPLDFWLFSDRLGKPVEASGQVVWQKQDDSGQWEVGVRFYKPNLLNLSRLIDYSVERIA